MSLPPVLEHEVPAVDEPAQELALVHIDASAHQRVQTARIVNEIEASSRDIAKQVHAEQLELDAPLGCQEPSHGDRLRQDVDACDVHSSFGKPSREHSSATAHIERATARI